jgi:hypothetical protein
VWQLTISADMLDACQATSALLYCVQEMHESMDITAEKEQFLTR